MTRGNTAKPAIQNSKHFTFCYLSALFVIVLTACITCFLISRPEEQNLNRFAVKSIPKDFSTLENVEPEDRDVFQFHGFKTSFLPSEEVVLSPNGWNDSDRLLWRDSEKIDTQARIKRSHRSFPLQGDNYSISNEDHEYTAEDTEDYNLNYGEETNKETDPNEDGPDDKDLLDKEQIFDTVVHPEIKIERGPLDDVIEQGRGQPELEEGEMGSSPLVYNQARSQSVLHAFWKAQGDRNLIRKTQSNIMKQYIDKNADPCEDFYQYACGNWMAHNPIPADKAGYDTFEMLREYLDTVLRDLLESDTDITTVYPGAHLDIDGEALQNIMTPDSKVKLARTFQVEKRASLIDENANNSEIINRIRRYLDKKVDEIKKPISKIKEKLKLFLKNQKKIMHTGITASQKHLDKRSVLTQMKRSRHRKLLSYQNSKLSKRALREETIPIGVLRQVKSKGDSTNSIDVDAVTKARFLYKSCMNYDTLHKRGHQPLLDLLKIFGGWPMLDQLWSDSNFDWLEMMAKLRLYNNDILISEWVGPDIKNSDKNVIQFDQTSLGLPSRDYFLQEVNKEYMNAYKNYLIKIALLLGGDPTHVKNSVDDVIEFEIRLANITSTPEDRRNVSELYQRMTIRKLESIVPEINWRRYLDIVMNRTVNPDETVVMFALTYAKNLVPLIDSTPSRTLANYFLWRFVRHRVNNLDDRFQSAKQQFYYILFGREQSPPRWKSCVTQVNSNMGMALGSLFVRKYFDQTSKNDTMTTTRAIRKSFRELLNQIDWIDHETKSLAAAKLDAMTLKIGYPDYILDKKDLDERYKEVKVDPDKYFENILNILRHMTNMEQSSLNTPVDKTLWHSAPAVVNAYYSRNKNQIMFPAGILQPPFYHRHFPKSLNFGGIGVVIGHEITHGFDDKGRLFDREGNLHRWWSDSAVSSFHRRAQCLIDQYGQYVVSPIDMKLDGGNTQGENIADNGGVKQAFKAYQHWIEKHGDADETLPGLNYTHTQLFFLNFAQVWCGSMRPEAMKNKLKTAVHSPGRFRVIGSLSNSQDFAREFACPPGSPMNPIDKCSVW